MYYAAMDLLAILILLIENQAMYANKVELKEGREVR